MAVQNYTVEYGRASTGRTALTNVQNITVNVGRQAQLDQYNASSATITLRYPTGYASPIADLIPGTPIRVINSADSRFVFFGRIDDVQATYGIPYAGGVGNADYLTISCVGALASWGRTGTTSYAVAADTIINQMATISSSWSLLAAYYYSGGTSPSTSATTITSNLGDWLNKVALTRNARMNDIDQATTGVVDVDDFPLPALYDPFYQQTALSVQMSDTTNNATNQVYNQITFTSLADNFYTQAIVVPEAFGAQSASTGANPLKTLTINTLSPSAASALDYADYLLNNYKTAKVAISSISCLANAQNTMKLDDLGLGANTPGEQIGRILNVVFRGTTYPCIIEGYTFSAVPGEARYTYYVSAADLNAYLILDNATFGTLDFNRLGY
jgi:hypothetical protein